MSTAPTVWERAGICGRRGGRARSISVWERASSRPLACSLSEAGAGLDAPYTSSCRRGGMWAGACRGLCECRREGDDDADWVPLRTEEPEVPCSPVAGRIRLPSLTAHLCCEGSALESSAKAL